MFFSSGKNLFVIFMPFIFYFREEGRGKQASWTQRVGGRGSGFVKSTYQVAFKQSVGNLHLLPFQGIFPLAISTLCLEY